MIQETIERPSHAFSVSILGEETQQDFADSFDSTMSVDLSPKDVYMRIASNLELIDLYLKVNSQIISENGTSRLFRQTTGNLDGIKKALDAIIIQVTFPHPWFPSNEQITFW